MTNWGMTWLLSMRLFGGRGANRFWRLQVPLIRQRCILLRLVLMLRPLYLHLPVGYKSHHLTHHFPHPPVNVRFHPCHLLQMMLLIQTHLLVMMMLIQCHLRRVRLLWMLSQRILEEVYFICPYYFYIRLYYQTYLGQRGSVYDINWILYFLCKFMTLIDYSCHLLFSDNFQERDPQKFVNHERKIVALPQQEADWFQSVLSLFGLEGLCMTGYTTVNHQMLNASWRHGTLRPLRFIYCMVKCLSHWMMSRVCYIFRSGEIPLSWGDCQRRGIEDDCRAFGGWSKEGDGWGG